MSVIRVLVADDEPIERMVVTKKLRKYFDDELEIVEAENGRETIEIFEKEPCDIVLMDIEMPGINGLEAAENIRKRGWNCEIIFLTAFDEFQYAKRAIGVRALEYLLKPAIDEELVTVLEEAIRLTEVRNHLFETTGQGIADALFAGQAEGENADGEYADEEHVDSVKMRKIGEKILGFIEAHYKEDIALQDVAGYMNYSDAYFCKIFKQCFDRSFIVYLSMFRVEKAKALLEDISVNVKDISKEVGYRDSNYFGKVFKRMTGVTPSEYRNEKLM